MAPLSVAGLLRSRLFARSTTVLTSATLTHRRLVRRDGRQLGPDGSRAPKQPGTGLDVGSPFEHANAGILYVAAHLPPPGRDGTGSAEQLTEIAELITAAGGRTLGLFSSMRAARAAAEAMRERLDTPVLCQGDDATAALVEQFAADPETSLFGTLSLWQGVDVPGPSLSLVLIDRIPFPRPDDPLLTARQRAVAARGGNGFMAVAASHAALLLAQGAGRLLRRADDRGVVAVLDSRMATARYGGYLRASLPPFWQTTDPAAVRQALARLRATPPAGPTPLERPPSDPATILWSYPRLSREVCADAPTSRRSGMHVRRGARRRCCWRAARPSSSGKPVSVFADPFKVAGMRAVDGPTGLRPDASENSPRRRRHRRRQDRPDRRRSRSAISRSSGTARSAKRSRARSNRCRS